LIFCTGNFAFAQNLTGYYVGVGGSTIGPLDTAGLRQLVNQGQLTRNSLVWKEGMATWAAAGTIEELSPLFPPSAPPSLPASHSPPPMPNQSAQEVSHTGNLWFNSFAPGFENNKFFINTGIGLGPTGNYNMGIPPISASIDFKVTDVLPITVGAIVVFNTWNWKSGNPPLDVSVTYRNIGIGARAMYHFNFLENLDIYAGITLGYVIQSASITYGTGYPPGYSASGINSKSFFLWGSNIGARYFFTDLIGVYAEVGYSGLQYLNAGLSLKF